ncbi:zinc-dependent alcohol dehydrogenase family protein [Salinisphaera sp. Q1T1-3]|uniref:zinc-dependent alcohol dehydrogenase family protein n=1 Tax=Salinisphaera sp. Q1T1-3 TaxID=2321229 RepID=UPI000E708589|nr:zinc-dependent alcohol dehydrogenase family protein [Salinisphaera sp. Q1T1-3]RJS91782.1 hypothetical protein D3260_14400 [Salinisphaera sp. Q1T1-3]
MTRVVRFHEEGGPEVLRIDDVEVAEPGPGEIRLRVKALGINRAEVMFRKGEYLIAPQFPQGLGYEAAGEVESVGPNVTEFAVGDAVSVIPAFQFDEYALYGETVLAPARAAVKHPAHLDWTEAAGSWMQFMTAWGALIDIAKLGEGDTVLIPAASSSVGLAAIQIANAVGARPIALTRSQSKVAMLQSEGAADVVVTEDSDLVTEVMRLTDGHGARVVFDPVGGPTFAELSRATAEHGILFIYGALSDQPTPLPLLSMLGGLQTARGYQLFEITGDDARLARGKRFIVDGLESGALKPRIDRTFAFDDIVDAHRYMESNQQIGKIVVTV